MKLVCVTLFASLIGCSINPPTLSSDEQHDTGCLDENGDEIPCGPCPNPDDCVVTIDPPDDDPCQVFPWLCSPGNPDPCTVDPSSCSDPCSIDPSSCTGGGSDGSGGKCWFDSTSDGTGEDTAVYSTAHDVAMARAITAAQRACSESAIACIPHSGTPVVNSENCSLVYSKGDDKVYACKATASVPCTYTWSP